MRQKLLFAGRDHRMDHSLEASERCGIAKNPLPEALAVDPAFIGANAGKGVLDPSDRRPARRQQPVHGPVGVEQRDPQATQLRRGGALPHPDRASQTDDDHRGAVRLAMTAARSSWLTRTLVPNQASNPGLPWCNSMPRPSTTG